MDPFLISYHDYVSMEKVLFIGASLSEPHTYRTAVQNPPYIYIYIYTCIYIYIYIYTCCLYDIQFGPTKGPVNVQRANVGPPSKGSKVNNIALKMATLVYGLARERFFQRSSYSSYE